MNNKTLRPSGTSLDRAANKLNGQSIIDVIFAIGILVLVLTGVMVLIVSTAKIKRLSFERQKAVGLSQSLIEKKTLEIKEGKQIFWEGVSDEIIENQQGSDVDPSFSGYVYKTEYSGCGNASCKIIFTINWGDGQSLSVEKFFSRGGI